MATKPTKASLTVKAVGAWKVLGESPEGTKIFGAKIWEGQAVEDGDIVRLLKWNGQASVQRVVGEALESVEPDYAKGTMGYTVYAVEPVAK